MPDYRAVFVSAAEAARAVERQRISPREAGARARSLLDLPATRHATVVRNSRRFRRLEVVQALTEISHGARFDDPGAMVAAARGAVVVAEALVEEGRTTLAMDARAEAWACLANAERVGGDLRAAEVASRCAIRFVEASSSDPLTEARVLTLQAALRTEQSRYPEAKALYWRAYQIYRGVDQGHQAARVLISLAWPYGRSGDPARAIRCLLDGLEAIDVHQDPSLVMSALHNLAHYLNESGDPRQALAVLYAARPAYSGDSLVAVRLRWLEARIATNLGSIDLAIELHDRNRQELVRRGLAHEAALASLDLAELYPRVGRWDTVQRLVEEMYPVFLSRDLHTEALASLLLFVDTVREGVLGAEGTGELMRLLKAARRSLSPGSGNRHPGGPDSSS